MSPIYTSNSDGSNSYFQKLKMEPIRKMPAQVILADRSANDQS